MIRRTCLALLAVVALAGCGGDPEPGALPQPAPSAARTSASPSPSPSAEPTSSPTPQRSLSRKQACQQVVEASTDWIYLIGRFADDPSTSSLDADEVERLADKITETLPYLDNETSANAQLLVYPLNHLYTVMTSGENQDIDLENARDVIPDVMRGCRGKADLHGYHSPWDK